MKNFKPLVKVMLFSVICLVFAVTILMAYLALSSRKDSGENIGVLAVKYMYNFQTIGELDNNMDGLKKITTPEVYDYLTLDRTDKALNVYLKFKNKPVTVVVDEVGKGYVIYSLDTESISKSRKFVFFFETGSNGKIIKAREGELLDFYADSNPNQLGD